MTLRQLTSLVVTVALCALAAWQVLAGGQEASREERAFASAQQWVEATATSAALAREGGEPDPGAGPAAANAEPTPTPYIVTPAPAPRDVFAAATLAAALATEEALHGTRTPTPPNMITATFTPPPYVVHNTPTPANAATATYQALYATAVAATTGTPTPLPTGAVTATPRPTATYAWRPAPTPTPLLVPLEGADLSSYAYVPPTPIPTPNALPQELIGRIGFRSDRLGGTRVFVMDPDGSNVALLTDPWAYEAACAQEHRSPDGRYLVYQAQGGGGLDLWLRALVDNWGDTQLTRIGSGVAYDMAWSPNNYHIAFTTNRDGNDEIYLVSRDGGDMQRLTHNEWEWDKHPSFSSEGSQIAYWSSVGTGRKQIWVMGAFGGEARNVSNSPHNDWDPVWFKGLW